jgi:hypothetical protein
MDAARSAEALLTLIREDRERRVRAIAQESDDACAQILRLARSAARERVKEALVHERRRLRDRLAACDASLATEVRVHDQRRFRALLDEAHARLPEALAARWRDRVHRAAWVDHVVSAGQAKLGRGRWSIAHGSDWPAAERAALAASLAATGVEASFAEERSLGPGLEIRAGGNRIDGTAAGLAADAGEVGARLLDALAAIGKSGGTS